MSLNIQSRHSLADGQNSTHPNFKCGLHFKDLFVFNEAYIQFQRNHQLETVYLVGLSTLLRPSVTFSSGE